MTSFQPEPTDSCPWGPRVPDAARGELDARDGARFEAHLAACRACRHALSEVESVLALFEDYRRSLARSPERAELAQRIVASIPDGAWRGTRTPGRPLVLSGAALVAAACLFAVLIGRNGAEAPPSPRPPGGELAREARGEGETLAALAGSALERARAWLVAVQDEDGGWNPARWGGKPEYRISASGLAVLALAGDAAEERLEAAARGARFLARSQEAGGRIGAPFHGAVYNHAVATRALLSVCRRSRQGEIAGGAAELEPAIGRALDYLLRAQSREGGWRYSGSAAGAGSVAVSIWSLKCLTAARDLGWTGLDGAIAKTVAWAERSVGRGLEEPARWTRGASRPGDAAAPSEGTLGALALLIHHLPDEPGVSGRRAADRLARMRPERLDAYGAYMLTEALHDARAPWQEAYRQRAQAELLGRQVTHGRFEGTWEPEDPWGELGGRLGSTALAALALERPL